MDHHASFSQEQYRVSTPPIPLQGYRVGRDSPHFQARKAIFSKFPEEWKREICSEKDNDKRLALFDKYARAISNVEEQRNHILPLQNLRGNHLGQTTSQSNLSPVMSSSRYDPIVSNIGQSPHMFNTSDNPATLNGVSQQARYVRNMMSHGAVKRVMSPNGLEMISQTEMKRAKTDRVASPLLNNVYQPNQTMVLGQRSPGGTIYIQQDTETGQTLASATMPVLERIDRTTSSRSPAYIQPPLMKNQYNLMQTLRTKQNLYPQPGTKLNIVNNTTSSPSSPSLSEVTESSSSNRIVPESQYHIPKGINRIIRSTDTQSPSPDNPIETSRYEQIQQSYNSNSTYNSNICASSSVHEYNHQINTQILPQQFQDTKQIVNPILNNDDLRKNPDYKAMIAKLREKFGDDLKRIITRAQLDKIQLPKQLMEIMQVLNFKQALSKDKWPLLEARIKKIIECSSLCYPLFAELRKFVEAQENNQQISHFSNPTKTVDLDPWKMCRNQFVHVPQFVLDAVNNVSQ